MDYLDPDVKKKHTRQLFIGYALMAVLIGLATTLFVLFTLGFAFDRSTGTIIQNGLVFVDSNPIDGNVYINGELSGRGDQRLVVPAGGYEVSIEEEGYRTWGIEFGLAGGMVKRLTYPFLIAEKLVQSTYRRFPEKPSFISTSPDREWLLLQESSRVDAFVLYDLSQAVNLPSFFSLPVGIMSTQENGSWLEVVEWSNDNQHVLVKHSFEGGFEYVLVNREQPELSQNITTRFADISFTRISLIDKEFDKYHLFDDSTGALYEAELQQDGVELLEEGIITYRSHGSDTILFVKPVANEATSQDQGNPDARVFLTMDGETYDITNIDLDSGSSGYMLDVAMFDGDWYVVVGSTSAGQARIYKNPVEQLSSSTSSVVLPLNVLSTEREPRGVSFSANARNIMLQSDSDVAVFDLEEEESYRFPLGDESTNRQSFWMDGHRIISSEQGVAQMVDFTGGNKQELVACNPRYRPIFDSSYAFMYCVAPYEDVAGGALTRTSLRVPPTTQR